MITEDPNHRVDTEDPNPELTAYKVRVRHHALRLKDMNDWCRDGVNEVLEELDLEPIGLPTQYTFETKQTTTVRYIYVADTEAEARSEIERWHSNNVVRGRVTYGEYVRPTTFTDVKLVSFEPVED